MLVFYYSLTWGIGGSCACIIASRLAKADPSLKILVSYIAQILLQNLQDRVFH